MAPPPRLFQVSPSDKILINFNPGAEDAGFFAIGYILRDVATCLFVNAAGAVGGDDESTRRAASFFYRVS